MNKFYTGVGSRDIPCQIAELIVLIASKMAQKGYILRSGGADGSDSKFEEGCDLVSGPKEIYLPWKGFNNSKSNLFNISKEAMEMAAKICHNSLQNQGPYFNNLILSASKNLTEKDLIS